jgi:hypothetical protein
MFTELVPTVAAASSSLFVCFVYFVVITAGSRINHDCATSLGCGMAGKPCRFDSLLSKGGFGASG